MNENDFRDVAGLFALLGFMSRGSVFDMKEVWEVADALLEARNKTGDENEEGIVAIKKRVRKAKE